MCNDKLQLANEMECVGVCEYCEKMPDNVEKSIRMNIFLTFFISDNSIRRNCQMCGRHRHDVTWLFVLLAFAHLPTNFIILSLVCILLHDDQTTQSTHTLRANCVIYFEFTNRHKCWRPRKMELKGGARKMWLFVWISCVCDERFDLHSPTCTHIVHPLSPHHCHRQCISSHKLTRVELSLHRQLYKFEMWIETSFQTFWFTKIRNLFFQVKFGWIFSCVVRHVRSANWYRHHCLWLAARCSYFGQTNIFICSFNRVCVCVFRIGDWNWISWREWKLLRRNMN